MSCRWLIILAAIVATNPIQAEFGDYVSHELRPQTLIVTTGHGKLRLSVIDDAGFEAHYIPDGRDQLPSFAIAGKNHQFQVSLVESEQSLTFQAHGLSAVIHKSPLRVEYFRDNELLAAEESGFVAGENSVGFRFVLDDSEKLLGGGERVLGMDRRGHRMPLYNKAHYGYTTQSNQMYYGLPAVMSSEKYAIVFDNSANGWLDIGATESDVLSFEAVGGRTSYLVIAGETYPDLVSNLTDVTGRQPMPPRWALGNFASRFGYRTEKQARRVVRRFDRLDIPLDAIVIDIYWFGPDIQGHMGNLDWDRDAWPNAEDMIADFAGDGVKTIAITQPFVLTTSNRWQEAIDANAISLNASGEPHRFDFYFGNTGLVDIFNDDGRDWFWQHYETLFKQGIAGTWGDLGEPEVHPSEIKHRLGDTVFSADELHNAFGHTWARMVYERQIEADPDVRPFIMMRSGFAGSQRYGIIPWTGDVSRTWDGLKPQVELSLQMGLLGLGYTHSDLGGFAKVDEFDDESYIRWLQYGVFQPVYRPHADEQYAPEPVFRKRRVRNIVRDFIKLRYRMLPYNYTLAYENSVSGMPLMRPVFFEDESDPSLIDVADTYLWGDAFLVHPITDPDTDSAEIALPDGVWFDFWTDERHESTAEIDVDLKTIPVLVRAGSFVPMIDDIRTTAEYNSEKLTLHYYADESVATATGQMYDDDGNSRLSIEHGQYELLHFEATQYGDSLTIDLRRDGGVYEGRPTTRKLDIIIHNWTADVDTALFAGQPVNVDVRNEMLRASVEWDHTDAQLEINPAPPAEKAVIYQVYARLFGNTNTTNKAWGSIEENGVGKFADFTPTALAGIRELGVTHIWYTGVPHHAITTDYTAYGISNDDPEVVKGRAGSPYAVKDYYNVNPDLATNPARRLEEFEELIARTHAAGMKVIIDVVPNHVARRYQSVSRPAGVDDLGANDDTSVEWARDNNFYYIVGEDFELPDFPTERYRPMGGVDHPLIDGHFEESPAKWSGNGASVAKPEFQDWYETVKVNHGVRPDGSYAFDSLPDEARGWSTEEHAAFWQGKDHPDSWIKYRDIVLYWLDKGVDGFRYDMAEMVPVEFWSFLNSSIKASNPDAFLFAEVYNPTLYRDYLQLGRMDYLYDKVGLYDALKPVMRGEASTRILAPVHAEVLDIEEHMLNFLENHDEERIASANFAGNAEAGKPAMVVSALIGSGPTMIYFAQELGEPGDLNDAAFNQPPKMRTTQYDYWGVPHQQRWVNDGAFDGGQLTDAERALRNFYVRLLHLSRDNVFAAGQYTPLNLDNDVTFAFARWTQNQQVIVASNFDPNQNADLRVPIPAALVSDWQLVDGYYVLDDRLADRTDLRLVVEDGAAYASLGLDPLESVVLQVRRDHNEEKE